MGNFTIDFFELSMLAEACIPPRPIARAMFWQNLTKVYWHQMTEGERRHIFQWLQKNHWYGESLEKEDDTKIFHARFDPDNQYMVSTNWNGVNENIRAFKIGDRYYTCINRWVAEEYIISVEKFTPVFEY